MVAATSGDPKINCSDGASGLSNFLVLILPLGQEAHWSLGEVAPRTCMEKWIYLAQGAESGSHQVWHSDLQQVIIHREGSYWTASSCRGLRIFLQL